MFKYILKTKLGNYLVLDRKAAARAKRLGFTVYML